MKKLLFSAMAMLCLGTASMAQQKKSVRPAKGNLNAGAIAAQEKKKNQKLEASKNGAKVTGPIKLQSENVVDIIAAEKKAKVSSN